MLSAGSSHRPALSAHGWGGGGGGGGCGGCGAFLQAIRGHRGLAARQGEEGRVDGDDDGELLLVVRGH